MQVHLILLSSNYRPFSSGIFLWLSYEQQRQEKMFNRSLVNNDTYYKFLCH